MTTPLTPVWLQKPMLAVVTPRKVSDFDEVEDDGTNIIVQKKAKADTFDASTKGKESTPSTISVITPPQPKLGFWESKFGTVAKWGIGGTAIGGISAFIPPINKAILSVFSESAEEMNRLHLVQTVGIVVGVGAIVGALAGVIPALLQKSKAEREQSTGYLVETAFASDGTPETKIISSPSTTYINTGGDGSYSSRYRDDAYGYGGGGYGGYYGGGYGGYGGSGGGRFLEDYLVASALGNAIGGGGRDYHHYHYGSPYNGYGSGYGYGGRGTTINNHHYYGEGTTTSHAPYYSSTNRRSSSDGRGSVFKKSDGSSRGFFSNRSSGGSGKSFGSGRSSGSSSKK